MCKTMRANIDKWTIVVTGNWNVSIFDPAWISVNLMDDTPLKGKSGTQEVFLDARGVELRHTIGTLRLNPLQDRLVIGTTSTDDDSLMLMQTTTLSILRILNHTPITGMGINFGFFTSTITDDPSLNLEIGDDDELASALGGQRVFTEIRRTFKIQDMTCFLNHITSFNEKGFNLELNFHYGVNNASQAVAVFEKVTMIRLRDRAIKLVNQMYNGYEENLTLGEE